MGKNTNDKHVFLNDRHDEQASLKKQEYMLFPLLIGVCDSDKGDY
jgi:hypothetical protein